MEKEETTPAWVTVGVHSFAKADEEMATDGLLLVLLAGGMGAHKRISSHTLTERVPEASEIPLADWPEKFAGQSEEGYSFI